MLGDVANMGVDAYVTADVKHDVFLDAHSIGMVLLDAGHFETEDLIVKPLATELKKAFPDIKITENHFSPIKYTK